MPVKKDAQGRNTSEKFDLGRNFCNKLWNAARFILATVEANPETRDPTPETRPTALPNRWILTRFARTVADANKALEVYRFDLYAKACYDFFWGDFCDWYLESTKVLLKNASTKAETLTTLVTVLDGALRLMHPVIPFITETLWEKLDEVAPTRPQCGKVHKRLILSEWATAPAIDADAEHVFPRMQEIIGTIRNLRNEHKVDPKKPVTVTIAPPDADAVKVTLSSRELIESLGTCTVKAIATGLAAPADSIRAIVNGNCDLYVEGLSDPAAQAQLDEKKKADLTRQIAAMEGRLANESYVAKAPPKLVEETKQKLADAKAELAKLG
jgi:valyl-tRNA synthetase